MSRRGLAHSTRSAYPLAPLRQYDATETGPGLHLFSEIEPYARGQDLVEGLILPGSLALIVGASGSRKTWWTADALLSIARGVACCGRETLQGPTLYVAAEAGAAFANRIVAYRIYHGIERAPVPFAVLSEPVDLMRGGVDTIKRAADRVQELFGAPLAAIAVDTLAAAAPGLDENAGGEMTGFLSRLMHLRDATGAAILCVHHYGKDASRGARGHSSLYAAMDSELTVEAAGPVSTVRATKQRDIEAGSGIAFRLQVVEIETDADGPLITSCVVQPIESPTRTATRLAKREQNALDALRDAMTDYGTPAPASSHIPQDRNVIDADIWRDRLFAVGVLDRNAGNPRSTWKRLIDGLKAKAVIGEWEGSIWLV